MLSNHILLAWFLLSVAVHQIKAIAPLIATDTTFVALAAATGANDRRTTINLNAPFKVSSSLSYSSLIISGHGFVASSTNADATFDVHRLARAEARYTANPTTDGVRYKVLSSTDLTPVLTQIRGWFSLPTFNATSGLQVNWRAGDAGDTNPDRFSLTLCTDGTTYIWVYNYEVLSTTITGATEITPGYGFSTGNSSYYLLRFSSIAPAGITTTSNVRTNGVFAYYYSEAKTSSSASSIQSVTIMSILAVILAQFLNS